MGVRIPPDVPNCVLVSFSQPLREPPVCSNLNVVEYPEEGFAIIRDTAGSYLIFRESDSTVNLRDESDSMAPRSFRGNSPRRKDLMMPEEEFEFA